MTDELWTQEQVDKLNAHQRDGRFHPFTCPGTHPGGCSKRELIATRQGWICACGAYTQTWAHDFMMEKGDKE